MQVSLEFLFHFRCDSCSKWWSIGDLDYQPGATIYCPRCTHEYTLPDKIPVYRDIDATLFEKVKPPDPNQS